MLCGLCNLRGDLCTGFVGKIDNQRIFAGDRNGELLGHCNLLANQLTDFFNGIDAIHIVTMDT